MRETGGKQSSQTQGNNISLEESVNRPDDKNMTAVSTYRLLASNIERSLTTVSRTPQVERQVEYYMEKIGDVNSIDEFMDDRQLYGFALKAYGLEEMSYAKAFIKKILEEGVDADDALAVRLSDQRYLEFATDFNFARYGEATTSFSRTQEGTVDKFYRQELELNAGDQNSGARLALYFERKASSIESYYSILGDPALLEVVQVAYNLPSTMSFADIDKQVEMISERLSLEDLKDPDFKDQMLTRFLTLWDLNNPETVQVPSILPTSNVFQTIDGNLLSTLQNLKLNR